MALFLSRHFNKVDQKGRVSVPAPFRTAVSKEDFAGVVLFRSTHHEALEGFPMSYMEEIGRRLENLDMLSPERDSLAAALFGECVQLAFDGDGRILLPRDLMEFAGITEQAVFVGLGKKFQIWNPEAASKYLEKARADVREKGLVLPKGGTP